MFARFQEVKQQKEALEVAQAGITVLTGEDRAQLNLQVGEAQSRLAAVLAEVESVNQRLAWRLRLAGLQQKQAELVAGQSALAASRAAHQADLAQLAAAEIARRMDPELRVIDAARESHATAAVQLAHRQAQRQQRAAELLAIEPNRAAAEDAAKLATENLVTTLPRIDAARKLDQQIALARQDCEPIPSWQP